MSAGAPSTPEAPRITDSLVGGVTDGLALHSGRRGRI